MTTQTLGLEDLLRLIDDLRLEGYGVGTRQYVDAQRLIIALAAHGRHPQTLLDLCPHLAPVLCSTPKEQENFYKFFPKWLARQPHLAQDSGRPPRPEQGGGAGPPGVKKRRWLSTHPRLIAAAVAVLLFAYPLAVWLDGATIRRVSGVVVRQGDKAAVPRARVAFRVAFRGRADAGDAEHDSAVTDAGGNFAFTYRAWHVPASVTVTHEDYDTKTQPLDGSIGTEPVVVTLTPAAAGPNPGSGEGRERQGNGNHAVAPVATPQPMPAESPVAFDAQTFYRRLRLAATLLPLLLFAAWWLRRLYWRRRMLLRRARSAHLPRLEHLTVKGVTEELFQGQAFRRIVQELRRHRPRGSRELDEQATIEATIRRGGLFTPFYGSRRTLPEYLVLIDRLSHGDQLAHFQEELVRRLAQDSLNLDTYYFRGDPRICRRKVDDAAQPATYLTLPDLAALHPDYYLLVFGDGARFIDPVTGKSERWLEQFSPWASRAIMTPESPAFWRFREWILRESDFLVLPAGRDGLEALGEAVNVGTPGAPDDQQPRTLRRFPEMLRDWPRRWLEDHEPPPEQVERLVEQLAKYLGPDGMNWLAACAVYPVLSWDVTLYLGFELFPHGEEFERMLLSLVSLPWLRHGLMPDWLRTALVSSLSLPDERAVRRTLENLLVTAVDAPPEGVRLDYSTRGPELAAHGRPELRRGLRGWLRVRRRRTTIRGILGLAPEGSPLHDYVFLTFLSGRRPSRIDLSVPDALRRILFPRGLEAFGPRPAAVVACALLLSLAGWAAVGSLELKPSQLPSPSPSAPTPATPSPSAPPAPAARESYKLQPVALSLDDWPTARFEFSIERDGSAGATAYKTLGASDISVTLDGQPVAVTEGDLKVRSTEPASVLILLDETGSMMAPVGGVNKMSIAKRALTEFIDRLNPSDVVGLVGFGDSINTLVQPTSDKSLLHSSLDRFGLRSSKSTRLYDAVEFVLGRARLNKIHSVVVISDGVEESPDTKGLSPSSMAEYKRGREERIANLAREAGVSIFTIAIGDDSGTGPASVDRESLSNLANGSNGGATFYINQFAEARRAGDDEARYTALLSDRLGRALSSIRDSLHSSYSLNVRLGQMAQRDGRPHTLQMLISVGNAPRVTLPLQLSFHWDAEDVPLLITGRNLATPVLFRITPSAVTRARLATVYASATAVLVALALFPLLAQGVRRRRARLVQLRVVHPSDGIKGGQRKRRLPQKRDVFVTLYTAAVMVWVWFGAPLGRWQPWPGTEEPPPISQEPSGSATPDNPAPPAGMVYVPGGEFIMGRDDGDAYEKPAHRVALKPFFIDTYEVTCGEYRSFIQATGHAAPPDWVNGNYPAGAVRKPVTGVNWDDANAYARWAGKRLPTEEEWEYAARGADGRLYPWGNEWKKGMANAEGASNGLADVGSYKGASPFGAYDMVGNAWEWTASTLQAYPSGRIPARERRDLRVIRGGNWQSARGKSATTTYRGGWPATDASDYSSSGFRLVKDIQ